MKINNIKDYDKVTIYIKKNKKDDIINRYQIFGWTLVDLKENKTYEDLVDAILIRPHKIKNKDELQLIQVYMEDKLNNIAKNEKNKHAKSTSLGICWGVFTGLFLVLGILILLNILQNINFVYGTILIFWGLISILLQIFVLPKLRRNENILFESTQQNLFNELNIICNKAKYLRGENEDK